MQRFQSRSDNDPIRDHTVARKVRLAAVRAHAMGLMPADSMADGVAAEDLLAVLVRLQGAGIGRGYVRETAAVYGEEALSEWLDELLDALEQSPVPETEWSTLDPLFGAERLAELLGISAVSLRRYASGARGTPDDVAARLHFVALVVGDLAGSYNDIGVRRWFERKRSQLGGKAPEQLLRGRWDPDAAGPRAVRALAASLLGTPAT
jgi:hypothetical protein